MQTIPRWAALVIGVAAVLVAPRVRAAQDPREPTYLWGIQRGCAMDDVLTRAVAERLQLLGTPVHTISSRASGAATRCLGSECAALLTKACGASSPTPDRRRGVLLGGHIEEQGDGDALRARIRLWRTDLGMPNHSYVRYERLTRHCAGDRCPQTLAELVATLAGQLLAETTPAAQSVAALHSAPPPYCGGASSLPAFFCAPFNLQAACGDVSDDGEPPAGAEILCPPAEDWADRGACDCGRKESCSAAARAACPAGRATSAQRLPLLRKGLGGSLIAGGAVLLGAGLLMILNNQTSLTLRSSVDCASGDTHPEKCYSTVSEIATSLGIGISLVAGGAVMLWDPQRLFSAERSSHTRTEPHLSLRPVRSKALTFER